MLGRRVRCKKCGEVFKIGDDAAESANIEEWPKEGSLSGTASAVTHTAERSAPAEFEEAFRNFVPSARPNTAFKFPWAALLDEWVPYISVGLALLCLSAGAMSSGPDFPDWVGWLRVALFALLFLVVILPLTWWMVQRASRKLMFELPPNGKWRTCAAFAFPFAFACLLWIKSEDLSGLIIGGFVGLLLGLAAIWLLIRLQRQELSTALRLTAGGYAAGMIISVSVLLFANAMTRELINQLKHSETFASSPIAPGFSWATAHAPDRSRRNAGGDSTGEPSTQPGGVGSQNPTDTTESPSTATTSTSQPDSVASSGSTDLFPASRLFGDSHSTTKPLSSSDPPERTPAVAVDPGPTTPTVRTPRSETRPAESPLDPNDSFLQGLRQSHSPLVAKVMPVAQDPAFSDFCPSLTASPWALLVSADKQADHEIDDGIDVWCMAPTPARRFQRAPFRAQIRNYVVSADGAWTMRIVTFPRLAVEVWSNADGVVSKLITLPPDHVGAKPTLLGFLSEDHFLIRWQNDRGFDAAGLEVWDIKTGKPARPILLPSHLHTPGNWSVSPDGKFYATVIRGTDKPPANKPQLEVFALAGGASQRMIITEMDPQYATDPAAIAFSPDNKKVAVMFEHDGNVAVYSWRLWDRKLTGPHLFPDGTLPAAPAEKSAPADVAPAQTDISSRQVRQFAWLSNNTDWLIRGDAVVDSESGRVIGQLGAKGAIDEWISGNTCLLTYRQGTALRMVNLQLKEP